MIQSRHAIIVLYMGEDAPAGVLKNMTDCLVDSGISIPELTTIIHKDEDAVADALIASSAIDAAWYSAKKTSISEAVESAIIYIGKRFEASLKGTNDQLNGISFALELRNAVDNERHNISFIGVGSTNELLNAIEILSTNTYTIPAALAKKYHFTKNVVEIVKKVYNSCPYVSR